jgi:hypothetical protein
MGPANARQVQAKLRELAPALGLDLAQQAPPALPGVPGVPGGRS